jgi:hypothetical protein
VTAGQALGRVQYQGHLAIDAVYQPLAADAPTLVRRFATPDQRGVLRITEGVVPLARGAISQLLAMIQPALLAIVVSTAREAELVADPDGPVDEAALALTGRTAYQSLRLAEPMVTSQIGMLLLRGASMQLPVGAVARTISNYLSPWFAPRRDAAGHLLRGDRLGAIRSWPGRAGQASAHVRGLMLFETTSGHARGMKRVAQREDRLLRWTLSLNHRERDACDANARQDVGYGAGLYPPDQLPALPAHFRCRCYAEPAGKIPFPVEQEAITGRHRGFPIP